MDAHAAQLRQQIEHTRAPESSRKRFGQRVFWRSA
jgi:hypothetical protein